MAVSLDVKDKKILSELDYNSRIPLTLLARRVRLSKEVVHYRIKKLVSERGFGFIAGNDGQDVFFHFSACRAMSGTPDPKLFENLKPGDSVEYELDRSGHHTGLRASLVSLKAYKADVPRCAICDRDTVQDPVKPILMSNKLVCRPCAYSIVALTAEMVPGPQGALAKAPIGSVSKARFSDGEEA